MRILLDENLPESLASALQQLGHHVDTINSLRLKGLDNGTLYREIAQDYDLCFTKDAGFVHNVRQMREPSKNKLLRVLLPQQPAQPFVNVFVLEFQRTDWTQYENGNDWRKSFPFGKYKGKGTFFLRIKRTQEFSIFPFL